MRNNHLDNIIPWNSSDTYEHIPSPLPIPEDGITIHAETTTKFMLLSHREHFLIALKIAPIWFTSNFAYNASLKYTSITSSTVLASTGSLFTYLFAILSRDEAFTIVGFVGVSCGVMGSALTGWSDVENDSDSVVFTNSTLIANGQNPASPTSQPVVSLFGDQSLLGDFLGLLSALGYGAYTVMIRVSCPHDENLYSMQLLLGYIGLINGISLMPVAVYIIFLGSSSSSLSWTVFGYVVAMGMVDNVLSDYLWARAVILTSATVATVGMGLTIPLAFFSDCLMGNSDVVNWQSLCGAFLVLIGFVLVNVGFKPEQHADISEQIFNVVETAAVD